MASEPPRGKAEFPSQILMWSVFGKYYCCQTSTLCWPQNNSPFSPIFIISSLPFFLPNLHALFTYPSWRSHSCLFFQHSFSLETHLCCLMMSLTSPVLYHSAVLTLQHYRAHLPHYWTLSHLQGSWLFEPRPLMLPLVDLWLEQAQ